MEKNDKREILEYDFDTIEIIKAGFAWIDGVKLQFVIALGLYLAIAIVLQMLLGLVFPMGNILNSQIVGILSYPILMPLIVGIMMMSVHHTRGENITFKSMFDYYHLTGKLAFAGILIYMMTIMGLIFFVLPGIYLSVAYIYAPMLIVDKNMEVWEAMEHSRKTVSKRWFKVGGLMTILGLIIFVGTLALGVGLIWAIPLMFVTLYGLLYPVMFELDEE